MNNIYNLIDEMDSYFDSCSKVFMSNKIGVDIEVIYEFLNDLRNKLPEEIKQAEKVVMDKDSYLADANKQAAEIINDAREQATQANIEAENRINRMVNEHEIMQKAYKEAELIIAEAKNTSRELKLGAYEYVDELILQFQAAAKDTLKETNSSYIKYQEYMEKQLAVLEQNRSEVRHRKNGKQK